MQVFVRSLCSRSNGYEVPTSSTVSDLKSLIEAREGLPVAVQGLVYSGRQLADKTELLNYNITAGSTVHLVLRLCGGKGGFGALLRGQGRDGKITTNFDACRDLQGRRIRYQTTEQKLAEWQAQAKERELEKVALQHMKELAKQQKREQASKVDVEEVVAAQREAVQQVQEAVQDALVQGLIEGTQSKHKRKPEADQKPTAKKVKLSYMDDLLSDEELSDDDNEEDASLNSKSSGSSTDSRQGSLPAGPSNAKD